MTLFIRLLDAENKAEAMAEAVAAVRAGRADLRVFEVNPEAFAQVPGSPFAYWVSEAVRTMFRKFKPISETVFLGKGPDTGDDFRFLRLFWEIPSIDIWVNHPKGGQFSRYYSDPHLMIDWRNNGLYVALIGNMRNISFIRRPGITWSRRTSSDLSIRCMTKGCVFSDKGPAGFIFDDAHDKLLAVLALVNSQAFGYIVAIQLAAADAAARSYEVGVIQRTPLPEISDAIRQQLAAKARRAWSIQRELDTTNETSHAFILPALLRAQLGGWDPDALKAELQHIQAEIDAIAFDLYGFSPEDRAAVAGLSNLDLDLEANEDEE